MICGKRVSRPTRLDQNLAKDIQGVSRPDDDFKTVLGKTMCAMDFYEGQARLNGAICEYTEQEKIDYLNKLHDIGVNNIEMESTVLAALSHHLGLRAAAVCVTFLNRLKDDQVICNPSNQKGVMIIFYFFLQNYLTKEKMDIYEMRPLVIVARFIKTLL